MNGDTRPCVKCLIRDLPDEKELARVIRERIEQIDEDDRAPEEEYLRRLDACGECLKLNRGTCALCGCYVEIRAARRRMHCPDVPAKWRKL